MIGHNLEGIAVRDRDLELVDFGITRQLIESGPRLSVWLIRKSRVILGAYNVN